MSITSSDSSKLKIFVFPIQIDEIINDLIEIDLSGGTLMVPFNGLLFDDLRVIIMIYKLFIIFMKVDYGKY